MRVTVAVPPDPVITWQEAQAHLRLDDDDEKILVEAMIEAATASIDGPDGWLGRSLGAQELEVRYDILPHSSSIRLPYGPVMSLVSVKYLDRNDVEHDANLDDFELLGDVLVPEGTDWIWVGGSMKREASCIRYRAGYDVVPAPIRAAILLMVADMFHSRATIATGSAMQTVPMAVGIFDLLQPYRVYL